MKNPIKIVFILLILASVACVIEFVSFDPNYVFISLTTVAWGAFLIRWLRDSDIPDFDFPASTYILTLIIYVLNFVLVGKALVYLVDKFIFNSNLTLKFGSLWPIIIVGALWTVAVHLFSKQKCL